MTYIFGARCIDGVVLVADRKVTVGETGRYEYQDKLFSSLYPIVWGSSGYQMFSDSFNNRVNVDVQNTLARNQKQGKQSIDIGEFRIIVEEVYERMGALYGDRLRFGGLSILMAQRTLQKSELWLIEQLGAPQLQTGYVGIGHGAPHASLFTMKSLFDPQKDRICKAAEVGFFVVKYIEKFQLDPSVGVDPQGGKNRYPQVWFLPDNPPEGQPPGDYPIKQATDDELVRMEDYTQKRLQKLEANLTDFWQVSVVS
jgi:hypothetical protein